MALPYPIANGQDPSGTRLQANLTYLEGLLTNGIQIDTLQNLRDAAALSPLVPFLAIATDVDVFYLYCGKATRGDNGFITIIDFKEIS